MILSNSDSFRHATSVPNYSWIFSPITAYDQNTVLNLFRNGTIFHFSGSNVELKLNSSLSSWSYKAQFILSCVQQTISYQIGVKTSKKLFFFDKILHFPDEESIVTFVDFDLVVFSTLELLQKTNRSTKKGFTFPDPVKNPSAFSATINIIVFLLSSIPLLSFWARTISATWFQQFLCHSITLMIETLCPMSTLNQQLTNLEQTHIRCSLPCEPRAVKGSDCT